MTFAKVLPYHPQGRGKIEQFNRRIKEKLCLVVYCSPDELKKAVDQAIATYNSTPHESLDNVSPEDVYAGRKEAILQRRKEKKRLTLERRKQYNLNMKNKDPDHHGSQTQVRKICPVGPEDIQLSKLAIAKKMCIK